ncbi:hypothetical protein [Phyllobacterium sp. SB3]
MKITMQLTFADLIRALRWRAVEAAEQVAPPRSPKNAEAKKSNKP